MPWSQSKDKEKIVSNKHKIIGSFFYRGGKEEKTVAQLFFLLLHEWCLDLPVMCL